MGVLPVWVNAVTAVLLITSPARAQLTTFAHTGPAGPSGPVVRPLVGPAPEKKLEPASVRREN